MPTSPDSPEGRAEDLMDMFTDDEVDIVHCLQGGYGAAQTIEFLDFDAIRANPKPFIGYSDITALHTVLRHYTELVTFYGPGLAGVNDRETKPFTQERLLKALTSSGTARRGTARSRRRRTSGRSGAGR